MSNSFRIQIEAAVDAVEVLSPTRHAWLGERTPPLPAYVEKEMDDEAARGYQLYNLTNALYGNFYCQGGAAPPSDRQGGDPSGDGAFVRHLSAANAGSGCWEPGWSVASAGNGTVAVERGGLTMWTRRDGCRSDGGAPLEPPVPVHVRFPKELLRLSPGFYMALGDVALPIEGPVVRLYWNLAPGGALAFIYAASRELNERALPARFKVVNDPKRYDRCDAGVVYVRREDFTVVRDVISAVLDVVAPWLGPRSPALTKQLAPGLGLAEDPGRGESFGLSRCQQIAEGIVRAHERGATALDERVAVVLEALGQAGVDIDAPYLNSGSEDVYDGC